MQSNIKVGIAVYEQSEFQKMRELSVDKLTMCETYGDWLIQKQKTEKGLRAEGIITVDILVKIDAFRIYCIEKDMPFSGATRSIYVSEKVKNLDETLQNRLFSIR